MDHVFAAHRLQGCTQEGTAIRFDRAGGSLFYPLHGADLEGHSYLLAEVENKADYAVCLNIGFWEEHTDKRSDLYLSIGVLPGITATVCVPLDYLNGQTLFGKRRPGILKTVVKGNRINREKLTAMAFTLPPSHSETELGISNVRLSPHEPEQGDDLSFLLDALGQYAKRGVAWKTGSREESNRYLTALLEEARQFLSTCEDSYYGTPEMVFAATGFFRTERTPDGCCWLVTPDGRGFFSSGIDCVAPHAAGPVNGKGGARDFLAENLEQAFGSGWHSAWADITRYRLIRWGINTVAAWSDMGFAKAAKIPFVAMLKDFPVTETAVYRDFPDVFSEEYRSRCEVYARQLEAYKDESYLIGYFMSNEPNWAFVDGLNLGYELLRNPHPLFSKAKLLEFLQERYGDLSALNRAWGTEAAVYEDLFGLGEFPAISEQGLDDLEEFSCVMIHEYIRVPALALKQADPHHLNLGIRYAYISSPALYSGSEYTDIFSINCYELTCNSSVEKVYAQVKMPIMIGEFHFGAVDRGLPATGIRGALDQESRGQAIRRYVEEAAALPSCVGVHYFQLNDQPFLGRFDGENYNIGLVDICSKEYSEATTPLTLANSRLYALRTGAATPAGGSIAYIPAIFY